MTFGVEVDEQCVVCHMPCCVLCARDARPAVRVGAHRVKLFGYRGGNIKAKYGNAICDVIVYVTNQIGNVANNFTSRQSSRCLCDV